MDPTDLDAEIDLGAVRSGEFVAEYVTPIDGSELSDDAVQPNGVDLSLGELYRLDGVASIGNDEYEKPTRNKVSVRNETYRLRPDNAYIAVYGEKLAIPENHIGLVFPRSRLMRCGLTVETAVWDAGYEGQGEGGISVNQPAALDSDLRIAQMIFIRTTDLEESYDGSHQGERLDSTEEVENT